MAKKRKVEETEEMVLGEVTTIQGIEDGGIPAEVVPIVVDDRICPHRKYLQLYADCVGAGSPEHRRKQDAGAG